MSIYKFITEDNEGSIPFCRVVLKFIFITECLIKWFSSNISKAFAYFMSYTVEWKTSEGFSVPWLKYSFRIPGKSSFLQSNYYV